MDKAPEIRVPTASLKALLDELPDVKLSLESMASEKIAEEIVRKASSDRIERKVKEAIEVALQGIRYGGSLPQHVKNAIDDYAKAAISKHLNAAKIDLAADVRQINRETFSEFEGRVKESIYNAKNELALTLARGKSEFLDFAHTEVKTLARAEFLSVIAEVKGAL